MHKIEVYLQHEKIFKESRITVVNDKSKLLYLLVHFKNKVHVIEDYNDVTKTVTISNGQGQVFEVSFCNLEFVTRHTISKEVFHLFKDITNGKCKLKQAHVRFIVLNLSTPQLNEVLKETIRITLINNVGEDKMLLFTKVYSQDVTLKLMTTK